MMMKTILSLLWLTSVALGSDIVNGDSDCPLQCEHDTLCVEGSANFSDHPNYDGGEPLAFHAQTEQAGMHCMCPPGWTGITCNRIYESCDGTEHKCYNGGKCIPGLMDYFQNEQLFCDCSNAINEINGNRFVGKYCEHAQTQECDIQGTFCVNGGICNPSFPDAGTQCTCSEGYDGPHCEFKTGHVPECTLACQHGGECQVGIAEAAQFHDLAHLLASNEPNSDYMRCICPPGYGGKLCDIPENQCGTHRCYNGGTCQTRMDVTGTFEEHHCDCTTAFTESTSYAGRFCQFESSRFCTDEVDQNGRLFCVNDGTCRLNPVEGCDCEAPYHGPSCEFQQHDSVPYGQMPPEEPGQIGANTPLVDPSICTLECENDGVCRKGAKDLSFASGIDHPDLSQVANENFEHCVCPEGWLGLTCQHSFEQCPKEDTHVCLNGSKCVQNGDEHSCDCANAQDVLVAGNSCEHHSTDICTIGDLAPGTPRAFCVNEGTCKAKVSSTQPHPGCDCVNDWGGPHCELRDGPPVEISFPDVAATPQPTPTPTQQQGTLVPAPAPHHQQDTTTATPPPVQDVSLGDSSQQAIPSSNGNNSNNKAATAMLVIGLLSLALALGVSIATFRRNKRERQHMEHQQFMMASATPSHQRYAYSDTPDDKPGNRSSRNVMNIAPAGSEQPEVYIGPPRDEDGHELHSVEIL